MYNEFNPETKERIIMSKPISLNAPAPDFLLDDFNGKLVRLSDYCGKKNIVLVFNRSFM